MRFFHSDTMELFKDSNALNAPRSTWRYNAPLQFPGLRPGSHTLKIRGTKVELLGDLEA
jgi:hypothetical protein